MFSLFYKTSIVENYLTLSFKLSSVFQAMMILEMVNVRVIVRKLVLLLFFQQLRLVMLRGGCLNQLKYLEIIVGQAWKWSFMTGGPLFQVVAWAGFTIV